MSSANRRCAGGTRQRSVAVPVAFAMAALGHVLLRLTQGSGCARGAALSLLLLAGSLAAVCWRCRREGRGLTAIAAAEGCAVPCFAIVLLHDAAVGPLEDGGWNILGALSVVTWLVLIHIRADDDRSHPGVAAWMMLLGLGIAVVSASLGIRSLAAPIWLALATNAVLWWLLAYVLLLTERQRERRWHA